MIQRLLIVLILLVMNSSQLFSQDSTYTNPVGNFAVLGDVADPCVLKHEGMYYLYATAVISHTYGFHVWQSKNLVDWEHKGVAFTNLETVNEWGKQNFWAPEVMFYKGLFYMVYSARAADDRLKIALASSVSPLGPFKNMAAPLLDENLACIDGHFFIDDDGTPYLFYAKDCSQNIVDGFHMSQIFVQKLVPNYLQPVGEPILAAQPTQFWECLSGDWRWNEGPWVIKHSGIYYLMYSANYFASEDYAIGYATALSPMGPWTKYEGNPILAKDLSIGVSGPGHNSVTTSPDGAEMFIVYHTHINPNNPSAGRTPNIDRLIFDADVLRILGPTRSPQPMPSSSSSDVEELNQPEPKKFNINSIFPNPFNNATKICYSVGDTQSQSAREFFVSLKIYNAVGEEIASLVHEKKRSGTYDAFWNGLDDSGNPVSTGVYICQLISDNRINIRKLMLLK